MNNWYWKNWTDVFEVFFLWGQKDFMEFLHGRSEIQIHEENEIQL